MINPAIGCHSPGPWLPRDLENYHTAWSLEAQVCEHFVQGCYRVIISSEIIICHLSITGLTSYVLRYSLQRPLHIPYVSPTYVHVHDTYIYVVLVALHVANSI